MIESKLSKKEFEIDDLIEEDSHFCSYMSTDKEIYQPGETIHWRVWLVHSITQFPLDPKHGKLIFNKLGGPAKIEMISPTDEVISTKHLNYNTNITESFVNLSDQIKLKEEQAGGNYKLKMTFPFMNSFMSCERKINVREFSSPPKLTMQLEFVKRGLGNGDEAHAVLDVKRLDG